MAWHTSSRLQCCTHSLPLLSVEKKRGKESKGEGNRRNRRESNRGNDKNNVTSEEEQARVNSSELARLAHFVNCDKDKCPNVLTGRAENVNKMYED